MTQAHQPTNGFVISNAAEFRNASTAFQNFVCDRPLRPLWTLPNFVEAASLVSMGAGTADLDEISTFEIGAVHCATTEGYSSLWELPVEADEQEDIDFRMLFSDGAAASAATQLVGCTYTPIDVSAATTLAAGATALDTIIAAIADIAANKPLWTAWGTITGPKTGVNTLVGGDDFLVVKFIITLTTLTSADLLWPQVRYRRKYIG